MIFYLRATFLDLTDTGTQFAKWTDMMRAVTNARPITKWADLHLPTSHYKFFVSNLLPFFSVFSPILRKL